MIHQKLTITITRTKTIPITEILLIYPRFNRPAHLASFRNMLSWRLIYMCVV